MEDDARKHQLEVGRNLERRGLADAAVSAYNAAGAPEEAARLLAQNRRYAEASALLLASLGVPPERAGELDAAGKRRALSAALYLARAGDTQQAVVLFVALGEKARAAELLQRAGDVVAAARLTGAAGKSAGPVQVPREPAAANVQTAERLEASGRWDMALEAWVQLRHYARAGDVAARLGRHADAADLYTQAGRSWEAAQCWRKAGSPAKALESLVRVPREDQRYREAAVLAVQLAADQGALDFRMEVFLTRFVGEPPRDESEAEAFYLLGRLYQQHDFPENARDAYRKLLAARPGYRDAAARLQSLDVEARGSSAVYEQILREDLSFRQAGAGRTISAVPILPDLPGLPDLPSLPTMPMPAGMAPEHAFGTEDATVARPMPGVAAGGVGAPAPRTVPTSPLAVPGATAAASGWAPGSMAGQASQWAATAYGPPPAAQAGAATAGARSPYTTPVAYAGPPGAPPPAMQPPAVTQPPSAVPHPTAAMPPQGRAVAPGVTAPPATRPPPPAARSVTAPPVAAPAPPSPSAPPSHASQSGASSQGGALNLAPGAVFAARYRIEAKIGQGGMAAVYRATDLELAEQIAIKVFSRQMEDEQMVARFKQELLLSRQLNHPNILRLYDIGAVDGCRYITMELLKGTDLKARLGKPLELAEGLDYMLQSCDALQHAHERGVVHRDIKPANLFLTAEGQVKLMDFGIAKRQATPGLTVAGMIAGTPEYMSPEQISGFEKVTASTDIYALGIMAYQIFTGTVPFRHAEVMPLLMMHLRDAPRPPRQLNPRMPEELEAIILKLLEKSAAKRFASCRELAEALQKLRDKAVKTPPAR